jgi:hypothetical protein
LKTAQRGSSPSEAPISIFELVKSQFRKLQAAIFPFKKQKSPASIMLLRPGLLCASTFASERQVSTQDPPIHIYCREALTLCRYFFSAAWLVY